MTLITELFILRQKKLIQYHTQLHPFSGFIHFGHSHLNVLMQFHYFIHIGNKTVFQLGDMHQPAFLDPKIYETAECRDVVHDAGQNHSGFQIFNAFNAWVKLKDFSRFPWI